MLAFIYAWVSIFLLSPSSVAILALSFAEYVSSPILTAIHFCPDPYLYYVINRLIASLCIGNIQPKFYIEIIIFAYVFIVQVSLLS